jgi:hypothetical protein
MLPFDSLAGLWAVAPGLEPFGALGVLAGSLAGLMPRRVLILACSSLCSACFFAHYLRLGSPTGAAMCALSVFQGLAAAVAVGADGRRRPWLGGLLVASSGLCLALTALTWTGWPSAFAGAGALLAAAARYQTDAHAMRSLMLACSLCWAGHNLVVGSVFGLICDSLTLSALAMALWRYGPAREPAARAAAA